MWILIAMHLGIFQYNIPDATGTHLMFASPAGPQANVRSANMHRLDCILSFTIACQNSCRRPSSDVSSYLERLLDSHTMLYHLADPIQYRGIDKLQNMRQTHCDMKTTNEFI